MIWGTRRVYKFAQDVPSGAKYVRLGMAIDSYYFQQDSQHSKKFTPHKLIYLQLDKID